MFRLFSFILFKTMSGEEPENIGNNNKSLIDSESHNPRNSTNTKEVTGAWLEDKKREKVR